MSYTGSYLGLPSAWSSNSDGFFTAEEYSLPLPRNSVRLTRKNVKRDVDTAMPVTPSNPLIRWRIPSNSSVLVDFKRAKILLDLSVAAPAPWSARCSTLAWNLFDRVRLEQGGQYVEDRRFFYLQESLTYTTQTHINQQITTGVALYGDGSQAMRNNRAAGWRYVLPFPTTALTKSIYPWFQMKRNVSGGFEVASLPDTYIQWELVKPEQFVEVFGAPPGTALPTSSTGLTYTITRMQIEYEEVYPEGGPNMILSKWLSPSMFATRGGFPRVWFRTWITNIYPLSTNTEQTIYTDFKLSSINTIIVFARYSANNNNPGIYDKQTDYIGKNDMPLIEYQWEINSSLWPDKPISLVDNSWAEGYTKYLEAWQMFHSRGIQQEVTPITIDQFLNDKFLIIFDGVQNPFSPAMLNPVSTANSGSISNLRLKWSSPPPAGIEIVVNVQHWKCWNFGSLGGSIPVIEV